MDGAPSTAGSWGLPGPRSSGESPSPELVARRSAFVAADRPPGGAVEERSFGGAPCVVCQTGLARATLLWFHGGGYRMGSATHSVPFGLRLAEATASRVVLVDYRLAPEHPFPAALHDAAAAYDALTGAWPEPLLVGGESAGGGLAAALVVAAGRAGRPSPAGAVLLSPWVDLTVTAPTYRSREVSDALFSAASAAEAAGWYLQGWPPDDPLASAAFADLQGFPPTALFASTDEVLLDDTRRLAHGLAEVGTEVVVHLVPGVPHVWPTLWPDDQRSVDALEEIARFVAARTRP